MAARMKTLLGLTTAGLAASAFLSPAAHADGVNFRFCNVQGNIPNPVAEYVAFPYRGWFASAIQQSGQCWSARLSGVANDEAVGYRQVNGQWLAVATKYFSDSSGSVEFDF